MIEPENQNDPEIEAELTPAGTPVSTEPPLTTPQVEERNESRFASLMRSFLRWLLNAAIFFVLGGLVVFFVLNRPLAEQLNQSQQELAQARGEISDLEARVAELLAFEETNTGLEAQLAASRTHLLLLSARVQVLEANLALANNEVPEARTALSQTDETLADLKSLIADEDQQATVERLENRLRTVLAEIAQDPATAQVDLRVMAKNLQDLENLLFARP